MIPDSLKKQFYGYLSRVSNNNPITNLRDLEIMSSQKLLALADKIEIPLLPLFINLLKSSEENLFEKLMGDHEEENKTEVDSFFKKYQQVILANEELTQNFNPLIGYLPKEVFTDLSFVQSRQMFFERQTVQTINEYFEDVFDEPELFEAGEQKKAWNYYWTKLITS